MHTFFVWHDYSKAKRSLLITPDEALTNENPCIHTTDISKSVYTRTYEISDKKILCTLQNRPLAIRPMSDWPCIHYKKKILPQQADNFSQI